MRYSPLRQPGLTFQQWVWLWVSSLQEKGLKSLRQMPQVFNRFSCLLSKISTLSSFQARNSPYLTEYYHSLSQQSTKKTTIYSTRAWSTSAQFNSRNKKQQEKKTTWKTPGILINRWNQIWTKISQSLNSKSSNPMRRLLSGISSTLGTSQTSSNATNTSLESTTTRTVSRRVTTGRWSMCLVCWCSRTLTRSKPQDVFGLIRWVRR